jgi:hypothetical protein
MAFVKPDKEAKIAAGFGVLVGQGLSLFWIEENESGKISHSDIINRLGWNENADPFVRHFVRVEVPGWKMENFRYDECCTLPGWAENNGQEIEDAVRKILEKIIVVKTEHDKAFKIIDKEWDRKINAMKGDDCPMVIFDQVGDKYRNLLNALKQKEIEEYKKIKGYVPE